MEKNPRMERNTDNSFFGISQMIHLRHEEQTYKLRGLIFDVHKRLKAGWPEEIYHQGLVRLMEDRGIPVCSKPHKAIVHRGVEVHLFECDLIAWDLIILELKVLPFTTFAPAHYAQLIHYLKCWGNDLGLLVNFGPTRAQLRRVIWDEPELRISEDYKAIESTLSSAERSCLNQIRASICAIGQQHGLGYPETVYRKLVAIEIEHNGLSCQAEVEVPARWGNLVLGRHSSDHLLVENSYLLNIRSLLDHPTRYDFARTKTYLNNLGLKFGFVVNFGKRQLQIFGVGPD